MKNNFLKCGLTGWCIEIVYTSLHGIRTHQKTLVGHTSLWMFPIYAAVACLRPVYLLVKEKSAVIRGACYAIGIFVGEYIRGSILKKYHMCPWDYSGKKFNIHGVIRLDYAPLWMAAGLLFERVCEGKPSRRKKGQ